MIMDHDQGGEAVQEDPAGAGRQARPPGQQRLRRGRFEYLNFNFESLAKKHTIFKFSSHI